MWGGKDSDALANRWMRVALTLGERGRGQSGPNPNVGCVIVKNGIVLGRGWTQPGGRPHAEAMALAQAGEAARGATCYVTLEPCAHESHRGPACSDLLIDAGIAKVIVGVTDPDSRTAGKGLARLNAAGIETLSSVMEAEAHTSMAGFLMRIEHKRPHVTLKLATSLDGQIAMADGTSRWITGERSRAHAHLLRARSDAILVGGGTLRTDKPRLDVRLSGLEHRSPDRIVRSREGAPEGWRRLGAVADIGQLPHNWLLVEGGAGTAAAFIDADLVDRLIIYRAPILIGRGIGALGKIGLSDLGNAHGKWRLDATQRLGEDILEIYERTR